MSILRYALQPQWLGYLALAVAFAVVTSLFGLWQWDRRQQAVAEIDRVAAHYDAPVAPLEDVVGSHPTWSDSLKWRPVSLSGRYLEGSGLLVRTRPRFGSVGFDVVSVFELSGGGYVLVNRGWVPTGASQDEPDLVPPPPLGEVELIARLLPGEPLIKGRSAPSGQVATINLEEIARLTAFPIDQRFYLALDRESPQPEVTPLVLERPSPNEGPHLSYTFQWFLFGALGFVAWGYLLREDYRRAKGIKPAPARRSRLTDQDVEDNLLDRNEAANLAAGQARDTNSA